MRLRCSTRTAGRMAETRACYGFWGKFGHEKEIFYAASKPLCNYDYYTHNMHVFLKTKHCIRIAVDLTFIK